MVLNPNLDIPALKAEFATSKRLRIRDFLQPDVTRSLAAEFASLPWKLFASDGSGVRVIDPAAIANDIEKQRALQTALMTAASQGQGFAYLGVQLKSANPQLNADGPAARLRNALASPEVLDVMRAITDSSDFDDVTAQASQFRQGHYLTRHLDDVTGEQRKYAFVVGLTQAWHPDWGGLLQFFTKQGEPTASFSPDFNTLDLFEVTHVHSVTFVTPFARAPRFAVSGWFVKT
jgi:Rps23 Pro-64 3,4-dihydroxylase Tpa1-like proline 4-hydroxylase